MKLFKSIHEYNYQWDLVSAANWQKYPNENCPHVQHVDVLNRTVDPETGILTTERLITVEQSAPRFILKVRRRKENRRAELNSFVLLHSFLEVIPPNTSGKSLRSTPDKRCSLWKVST